MMKYTIHLFIHPSSTAGAYSSCPKVRCGMQPGQLPASHRANTRPFTPTFTPKVHLKSPVCLFPKYNAVMEEARTPGQDPYGNVKNMHTPWPQGGSCCDVTVLTPLVKCFSCSLTASVVAVPGRISTSQHFGAFNRKTNIFLGVNFQYKLHCVPSRPAKFIQHIQICACCQTNKRASLLSNLKLLNTVTP